MVDIDGEVVEECKKHLPEMHQGAFEDPRTRVLHEDARAYLEKTKERFDLIVVDLPEPLEEGPACLLFTTEFYTLIRDRLTDDGVMTMQAGMTKINELFFYGAVNRTLREVFPVVAPYQGFISCFGTPWGFILASKGTDPRKQTAAEIDALIASRMNPDALGYWNGAAHLHSFNLPKFLTNALATNDRVITDKNPLIVS
jgi:spermidine synthase